MSDAQTEHTQPIDLTGLTIIADDDLNRVPLQGRFGPDGLADKLAYHWLMLRDCRVCGRHLECTSRPLDDLSVRQKHEEPCAETLAVVRNHLSCAFPVLAGLPKDGIQTYLDAAYYLFSWLDQIELATSQLLNPRYLDWLGPKVSPRMIASYTHLRGYLDKAAGLLMSLPEFGSMRGILLVEGQTEEAFVEELRGSHLAAFKYLRHLRYGGQPKRAPSKLELYVTHQQQAGYDVYLQGDSDGKGLDWVEGLAARGLIAADHVFAFTWDFETALPPALLAGILVHMGVLSRGRGQTLAQLRRASPPCSAITTLKREMAVDITSHKIQIARLAAKEILRRDWWQDPLVTESELGKFVHFVSGIP